MATATKFENPKVGLAGLLHTPEWKTLTDPQQAFCAAYIASGVAQGRYDALDAARVAYPNVKSTAVWASRLLQNKHVKQVIALHLGMSETEVVLADVKALIKKSKRKGARLDFLVPYWIRTVAALEEIAAKGNTLDVKTEI
jgi:phage terminase small subunit